MLGHCSNSDKDITSSSTTKTVIDITNSSVDYDSKSDISFASNYGYNYCHSDIGYASNYGYNCYHSDRAIDNIFTFNRSQLRQWCNWSKHIGYNTYVAMPGLAQLGVLEDYPHSCPVEMPQQGQTSGVEVAVTRDGSVKVGKLIPVWQHRICIRVWKLQ